MIPPLKETIERVSRLLVPALAIHSYEQTFEDLWSFRLERIAKLAPRGGPIAIFWDRTPNPFIGSVRIGNYISPIDWALAKALEPNPDFLTPVLLLDPGFEQAAPDVPHMFVRALYRNGLRPIPSLEVVSLRSPAALTQVVRALRRLGDVKQDQARQVPAPLLHLWAGAISSDPSNHHSIANLLGPRLLGEASASQPQLLALGHLLPVLGLTALSESEDRSSPWFPREKWQRFVERFVLLDDMADKGWARLLERVLDAQGDQLVCWHEPDRGDGECLIKAMEAAYQIPFMNEAAAADGARTLATLRDASWDKTVLLLDLRLFADRPVQDEKAFVSRLLAIAEKQGIGDIDLTVVSRWISNGKREGPGYDHVLALLPLTIAAFDPTLPIVTFSSTGRRSITDVLARRRNIILDFAKPRVVNALGQEELVNDARFRFVRAMTDAVDVAQARELCRRLNRIDRPRPDSKWQFVEIFIDESGDPSEDEEFAVGGIAIMYEDGGGPEALDDEMRRHAVLRWGMAEGYPPSGPVATEVPHTTLAKKASTALVDGALKTFASCVDACRASVVAFSIVAPRGTTLEGVDRLYHMMLRSSLEALLSIVLPNYVTGRIELAVHIATRLGKIRPKSFDGRVFTEEESARRFHLSWLDTSKRDRAYYSFGEEHAFALVTEVLSDIAGCGIEYLPTWSRGVSLRWFEVVRADIERIERLDRKGQKAEADKRRSRFGKRRPFQRHYVVDYVLRRAWADHWPEVLHNWYGGGFREWLEPARHWIDAHRLSRTDAAAENVLAAWLKANDCKPAADGVTYPLAKWSVDPFRRSAAVVERDASRVTALARLIS